MSTPKRLDIAAIAQRLADRRAELRLEQTEVAERAGLSRAYISRLERGTILNPKVFDLEQVARALRTSIGALMHSGASSDDDMLRHEVSAIMGPGKAEMVEEIVRKSADLSDDEVRLLLNVVREHAKEIEDRGN